MFYHQWFTAAGQYNDLESPDAHHSENLGDEDWLYRCMLIAFATATPLRSRGGGPLHRVALV